MIRNISVEELQSVERVQGLNAWRMAHRAWRMAQRAKGIGLSAESIGHSEFQVESYMETFAKRPLLPNSCACPVECAAYSSGVRLKF
jgi:hypothetical protein